MKPLTPRPDYSSPHTSSLISTWGSGLRFSVAVYLVPCHPWHWGQPGNSAASRHYFRGSPSRQGFLRFPSFFTFVFLFTVFVLPVLFSYPRSYLL